MTVAKRKQPVLSKKPGRKPWTPDYDKIEQWALQGLADKEIAALSGIHHHGFCQKKTELPELRRRLEYGRAKGIAVVSQKLLQIALSGDTKMIMYYLSRRGGWTERIAIDKKDFADMTTEELLSLRDKIQF